MDPEDRRAARRRRQIAGDGADHAALDAGRDHGAKKSLARAANQDWPPVILQFAEPRERISVLPRRLTEADARIEDDVLPRNAGAICQRERAIEEPADV